MQFLAIVKLLIQLLPLISDLVAQAETIFPQAGTGAHKLAVVKGALETAYTTGTQVEGTFEQVWPALNSVVTNVVAAKKAIQSAAAQEAP